MLVDQEWENRQNRKIKNLIRNAGFRYPASIIISSQVPVSGWHELIGEETVADAILDRIIYSSHRIELKGESTRKNKFN